jgi:cell division protein ZapA
LNDTAMSRVSVRILEKEYQFSCPPDERAALLDSAEYLNGEMKKIRDSGKVIGLDRIAVMAALNMANELLRLRSRAAGPGTEAVNRVRVLRERIESTLERGQQLEL